MFAYFPLFSGENILLTKKSKNNNTIELRNRKVSVQVFLSHCLSFCLPASAPRLVFIWNLKSNSSKYVYQKPSKSDLDINNQMFFLDKVSDSDIPAQPGDVKQRGLKSHTPVVLPVLAMIINGFHSFGQQSSLVYSRFKAQTLDPTLIL